MAGSAVFPIHYRDRVYATFNLYAGEADFFGEQEVETLLRMMADVSYALVNIDHERERLHAEEEIRALTERLRYYLNVSPVINYALSRNGGTWAPEWVSDNITRISGYSVEEAESPDWWPRHVHPEDRDAAIHAFESLWQKDTLRHEYRMLRKDTSIMWVSDELLAVRDAGGEITRIVGAWADITEKKQAEESLRLTEVRYRDLFDTNPVPMWIYDQDTLTFLAVNDAAVAQYGYTRDEFLGMSLKDLFPKDDLHNLSRRPTLLHEELTSTLQQRHRRKCGEVFPVEQRVHEIFYQGRKARVASSVDVTERMRAEQALAESEERLRRAVEAGRIGLWDWNPSSDTFECTDEWLLLLGLERPELSGSISDWTSRMHPEDLARMLVFQRQIESHPSANFSDEYRLMHKDGEYRWFLGSFALLRGIANGTTRLSGAHIDITSRKELEEQFRQAQKMESIGRLAGGVAHDFNNLLSVIGGYTEMALASLPAEGPLQHDLIQVKHAADRAANLTRQLLAFSRRQVMRPELLNLNRIITDSEKMLHRLVGEDIAFKLELDTALGKTLADPGQIEQVFLNLVVNARDAMPYGGEVTFTTRNVYVEDGIASASLNVKPGDYVTVTVRDTGTGMDPATLQRIFEPFFTTKEQGRGTGLGLATVYGIVQQSGGGIGVESAPGCGTTFSIYFPRVAEQPGTDTLCEDEEMPHGTETVLLVEDEEALRQLTERILLALGYTVLVADSGDHALSMMKQPHAPIALLLTDVVMPGISGAQLARELTTLQPGLPVLYMSGYTDDALLHHGVLDKDTHLINKPFSPITLAKALRAVLDSAAATS